MHALYYGRAPFSSVQNDAAADDELISWHPRYACFGSCEGVMNGNQIKGFLCFKHDKANLEEMCQESNLGSYYINPSLLKKSLKKITSHSC